MFSVFTAADPGAHLADTVMNGGVKSRPMLSALLTQAARAMPVSGPEQRVAQDLILESLGAKQTGRSESLLGSRTAFESLIKFSPPLIPGVGPTLSELLFDGGQDVNEQSSSGEPGADTAGGGDWPGYGAEGGA